MTPLVASIIAVAIISLVSMIGIVTLSLKEGLLRRGLFLLTSLAAGALLGDAFFHLIPEAFAEVSDPLLVPMFILAGILVFFILEKYLHWHHSHGDDEFSPEHARIHPVGHLVLTSDAVHNLVDGLAIGAAFMVSTEVGIATTVAIALHEIPQEIGDFGLLLHAGYSRMKALFVNFLSALTAFLGLAIAFLLGSADAMLIPLIAAFSAGMFIYIAMSDVIPELHKTVAPKRSALQVLVLIFGIAAMAGLLTIEGDAHGHSDLEHEHEEVHAH